MNVEILKSNGYIFSQVMKQLVWVSFQEVVYEFGANHEICAEYHYKTSNSEDLYIKLASNEVPELYTSESNFKSGRKDVAQTVSLGYYIRRAAGFDPIKNNEMWVYKDGNAQRVKLEGLKITVDSHDNPRLNMEIFHSRDSVFKVYDYIVTDEEGNTHTRRSMKSRIAMSDNQKEIIKRMKELLEDAKRENVKIYAFDGAMYFAPSDKVDNLTYCYDDSEDYDDITDIVEKIPSDIMGGLCDEYMICGYVKE